MKNKKIVINIKQVIMPGKRAQPTEDEYVEDTFVKEEEDSDDEEEEDLSVDGEEEDETEGFKMPDFFDRFGMGDWGGMLTMFIIAVIAILMTAHFMEIDLGSLLGTSEEGASLIDNAVEGGQ